MLSLNPSHLIAGYVPSHIMADLLAKDPLLQPPEKNLQLPSELIERQNICNIQQ